MPTLHDFIEQRRGPILQGCRDMRMPELPAEPGPGLSLFIDGLVARLQAPDAPSRVGAEAHAYGALLLAHGLARADVVREYGNVCQMVTRLAIAESLPMTVFEFQILNACIDDAVAGAMAAELPETEWGPGFASLVHEIRNHLNTALLAAALVKGESSVSMMAIGVLDRSLAGLRQLVDGALLEVRLQRRHARDADVVALDPLLAEIGVAAQLAAAAQRCEFSAGPIQPGLMVHADVGMLHSAIWNLLQNAFKFTRLGTRVTLTASEAGGVVQIAVSDECGGLPTKSADSLFTVYEQRSADRSGLGLGLSIARRAVVGCGGQMRVTDRPGTGCSFAIELPAGPTAP